MFILAFLFVIGILVFFHELGHFVIAKRQGVRVEKFSLGFGKKLIGFTRGETEYLICALPLGGYVKMYGEDKDDSFILDKIEDGSNAHKIGFRAGDKILKAGEVDIKTVSNWSQLIFKLSLTNKDHLFEIERNGNIETINPSVEDLKGITAYTPKEYKGSFLNKSILSRFLIIIAGPMMNFILPFFLLPIAFMLGIKMPAYIEKPPIVDHVVQGSSAYVSGFEIGDKIKSINGKKVKNWRDVIISFQANLDSAVDVEVERNTISKNLNLQIKNLENGIASVGLMNTLPAKIDSVRAGFPAQRSGIQKGDIILKIDDQQTPNRIAVSEIIRKKTDQQIDITVDRQGEILNFQATPENDPQSGRGVIGITFYTEEIIQKYGIIESITKGIKEAANMVVEITVVFFGFLFNLITGQIGMSTAGKSLAGPLFIAKISGTAAQVGFGQLLQFTSLISINLAIINLLPIPVLDGGHILFLLIEKIKGKTLSDKTMEITHRFGFSLLIVVMFLAVYNDFLRLKGDIFDWLTKLIQVF